MEDLLLTIIVLAITFQWGDWRHWKQYYPTILFWALGNFICLSMTIEKPLWKFTTHIPTSIAEILMTLVIFPCVVLLFIPFFPNRHLINKVFYIILWAFVFAFIEWWALKIDHFSHFNGWKLAYSTIFNLVMFTLLHIHYKDPRWAWLISLVTAVFIMAYFKIPL